LQDARATSGRSWSHCQVLRPYAEGDRAPPRPAKDAAVIGSLAAFEDRVHTVAGMGKVPHGRRVERNRPLAA